MITALASPFNWVYKADILAKDMHWYETHVMGSGPFVFVEHVKGAYWAGKKNPSYWDKGKPYLDSYRALVVKDGNAQVAAVRAERAHIQFRGFTPAERDSIVQALGPKATVQESPWDCVLLVGMNHEKKPWDDKRARKALTLALDRYQGSQALSKIAVVKSVGGVQVPGTPFATPPDELEKLAGYSRDIAKVARRGAPAPEGSRRPRELLVRPQEPQRSDAVRGGGDLARRSVAANRVAGAPRIHRIDEMGGRSAGRQLRGPPSTPSAATRSIRTWTCTSSSRWASAATTTAATSTKCWTISTRSRAAPSMPRSGRNGSATSSGGSWTRRLTTLHAPVAPDHSAQRQAARLDRDAEPLPEQPARHRVGSPNSERLGVTPVHHQAPALDDPDAAQRRGDHLFPDADRPRRHRRAQVRR
jgi:hypothetical protein